MRRRRASCTSSFDSGRWMPRYAVVRSTSACRARTASSSGSAKPALLGAIERVLHEPPQLPRVHVRLARRRIHGHERPGLARLPSRARRRPGSPSGGGRGRARPRRRPPPRSLRTSCSLRHGWLKNVSRRYEVPSNTSISTIGRRCRVPPHRDLLHLGVDRRLLADDEVRDVLGVPCGRGSAAGSARADRAPCVIPICSSRAATASPTVRSSVTLCAASSRSVSPGRSATLAIRRR